MEDREVDSARAQLAERPLGQRLHGLAAVALGLHRVADPDAGGGLVAVDKMQAGHADEIVGGAVTDHQHERGARLHAVEPVAPDAAEALAERQCLPVEGTDDGRGDGSRDIGRVPGGEGAEGEPLGDERGFLKAGNADHDQAVLWRLRGNGYLEQSGRPIF